MGSPGPLGCLLFWTLFWCRALCDPIVLRVCVGWAVGRCRQQLEFRVGPAADVSVGIRASVHVCEQ